MKLKVKIISVLLVFGWQVTTFGPVCQASTRNRLDYSKIENLQHPRLLMFEEDFERLRSRVMGNEKEKYAALLKAHSLATGLADSEIENQTPISHTMDDPIRMLSQSRQAMQRLLSCAYAWKTSGDEKYLEQVKVDLDNVCSDATFPDWNVQKHHLDAGEMAFGVAVAYDWCYNDLPSSTRESVRRALMQNALTAAHDNSFRQSCNNHNQVCYTGFVAAALAIYELEKDEARWWLEDALENNLKAQVFSYSPDGNHAEGAGYWNYGTSFECMTIAMLYKIFGTTGGLADVDGFDHTGLWVLYTDGADKWRSAFNFMDYMDGELSVRYALWWMAEYYHKPELLVDEMRRLLGDTFRTERVTPILPCWVNSLSFDPGILRNPETRVWSGAGIQPVLIVHTDWTFSRTDKYLGVKGGTSDAPHGHMDAGSFVYDAFGHRWAEDLGGQGYAALESALGRKGGNVWLYNQNSWRWKVFRLNNYGHGTLTLDGRLHNTNGKATILETYEDDSRLGGKLDMGSVLSNGLDVSASRSFELVGNALTVTDSIAIASDGKSHEITWQIITGAKVRLRDNRIILRYGRDKMAITPKCGGEVSSVAVFSQPAKGPEEWDAPNPGRKITGFKIKTLPNAGPVTIKTLISPDEK